MYGYNVVVVNTIVSTIIYYIAGTIKVYAIFSGRHLRMRMKLLEDVE